jgi:putative ABC transport system permease protein
MILNGKHLTSLNRKLIREIWKLKGQMISIALVVAVGVMSIVSMRGSFDSLLLAQQQYYRESRFADVWVSLVRAPQVLLSSLEAIPGVDTADTRVTFLATLDLDDTGVPSHGRFVSIPDTGRPVLNDLQILRGRYINVGANHEVIISENFAEARDFEPGDKVRAIINGRARVLDIVGIGVTPEYIYAVPPGGLYPEDERYGVFWASRDALGPAFDMQGAFNEAFFSLTPDANEQAVIESIDDLLEPYGGLGAYPRSDQPSHLILDSEIAQNRVTGAAIPMIFLGVAVFLLYMVLGRLISTQRGEIAVLKAFGYRDWEVGTHFLMFAVVAVILGGIVGSVGGLMLGDAYIALYAQYFKLPNLTYRPSTELLVFAFCTCVLGAFAGALAAVRRAVLLPPAEAMRPEAPARFKAGVVESLGIGKLIGASGRMILRNFERKPIQAFFSSLGIAMAVAILIIGFFIFDSVQHMMDMQFRHIQREDLTLTFRAQLPDSVSYELANIEGVNRVETIRTMAARLRAGHLEDEVAIMGLDPDGELRRVINADGAELPLPSSGLLLSKMLAERLQVHPGDELVVEFLQGKRRVVTIPVDGLIEESLGLSVFMSKDALWKSSGEFNVVDGAFLGIDKSEEDYINAKFKEYPAVTGVTSPASMFESFQEQLADGILISSGFLLGFAGVIAVGVIYNAARISLSERGRELASLRVMGFHQNEVATLLLGEQALVTLVAIPMGWAIGYSLCYAVIVAMETDIYRLPFVADSKTILLSGLYILLAAFVSGLIVKKRLDKIELVEVLKTRE